MEKNFEDLAKNFSLPPEAEKGGDVGLYARGQMPPVFDKAFDLKVGQYSKVIESAYGFHIFLLIERFPERVLPLEEVKIKIEKEIREQKEKSLFQVWLKELNENAKVVRNEKLLSSL